MKGLAMSLDPVVALDVGTSKVCAIVGDTREDGNIMIMGKGECPALSVRKGVVCDIEKVASCILDVVKSAEKSSGERIRSAYLTVSGGHIQSLVSPGSVPVYDSQEGITVEDIEEVKEFAKAVSLSHDRERIHSICQKFSVDDQFEVLNPEGMRGGKLSVSMLMVHGAMNRLNALAKAAISAGLKVNGVMFDGLASALATLTSEQKRSGVVLIDLGAGTSSYVAFVDEIVAAIGVLAVGGDHVTNDIALAFNLSHKRAEQLKREVGSAAPDSMANFHHVNIPSELGFLGCSVASSDLNAVINARVDELFTIIKSDLDSKLLPGQLAAGVVLTGGGCYLRDIERVASSVFDLPCAAGMPRGFSGIASVFESHQFSAALGMVRHGCEDEAQSVQTGKIGGFMKRLLGARG